MPQARQLDPRDQTGNVKTVKTSKFVAIVTAFGAAVTLAACSNDDSGKEEATATTASSGAEQAPAAETPTAAELNEILARATDPNLPMEERTRTVQGGENAVEIFDVMTQAKHESGADFQVVEPILPGYTPTEVLAAVNFTQPDQGPTTAENVSFVYEDGTWKLSQSWACTLIHNTVAPDQVPAMCGAQAPEQAPEEVQIEDQAPAPAPDQAPAL